MRQKASFIICIERIEDVVFEIEKVVCGILIAVMTGITLVEVFLRYVLKTSLIVGINELINWTFVWTVFIGMAMLVKTNEHINIGFIKSKLPKLPDLVFTTIIDLALVALSFVLILKGLEFVKEQMNILTTSANIPKAYLFLATPVGMALLLFQLLVKTLKGVVRRDNISSEKS